MRPHRCLPLLAALLTPAALFAQGDRADGPARDSVTMAAGEHHRAGAIKRFFFGTSYRQIWRTPITVPVLDLDQLGGLRPVREGGGKQTRSLYLSAGDADFVFRSVGKDTEWGLPARFRNTIIAGLSRDQVSTSHPAGCLIVAPLMAAAGIAHPSPSLAAMPDDPRLGEYRERFAHQLGFFEEYPSRTRSSDSLRTLLNAGDRVDAPLYLAARLMDMMVSDWDRHPGNWRWYRAEGDSSLWLPFPRDRDKAFASYSGLIAPIAQLVAPTLRPLRPEYPPINALTFNSGAMDRRLLAGLGADTYDSVALSLQERLTDQVLRTAVGAMPAEYHVTAPFLLEVLQRRRDDLRRQAAVFHDYLARVVDVHATDQDDLASVARGDSGQVELRIATAGRTWYRRVFRPASTREVRLYLHEGNDSAAITGAVQGDIVVRVIGGNGANTFTGDRGAARLYDEGRVTDVRYGADTLFDRRPWVREHGHWVPPRRDRGMKWKPVFGFSIDSDLGFTPRLGLSRDRYAFGHHPYASRVTLEWEYATTPDRYRVNFMGERRRERSRLHFAWGTRFSGFEQIAYYGLGNDTRDSSLGAWHAVRQQQWTVTPAIAWSVGPRSNFYFGPIFQHTTTDSTPGTLLAQEHPYGLGSFSQAGLRLALYYDVRDQPRVATNGLLIDASSSWYPAMLDAAAAFGDVRARVNIYRTLPLPLHPILAIRTGGQKSFGTFPYHAAAYIGGRRSAPDLDAQRYAGDAALYGTAELRVPLLQLSFLLPLDIGVFGSLDHARVYVDGQSPGGWHRGAGAGFWIGILDPATAIAVTPLGGRSRTGVIIRTGLNF